MVCGYVWDLEGFFRGIPGVVWSGVIGAIVAAGISLLGVYLANASSLARLRVQHAHDKEEADTQRRAEAVQNQEDRKAAIRREAYTGAIEAVHEVLALVGHLPELRLHHDNEDEALQKFLQANSKVWLVAEAPAAHLSRDLTNRVAQLYLSALQMAHPFREKKEAWWQLGDKLEAARSEVKRIESAIAQAQERGAKQEDTQPMIESWKATNDWIKSLVASREQILTDLVPLRVASFPKMIELMRPVQETIVDLVSALRGELGLASDHAEFRQQLKEQEQFVAAAIQRLAAGA
ncbi:hypothetical protein [Variovorax sp. OV084]|uniref:hypothetical protein n=1 Tax=Variovorax sp. OV084 TaxID=1882777 RepID=UPI0008B6F948|nr:hypothetical protein [Variovorax sp. OV084]SES75333.1 hypothetical protein SAMN05443580_101169 [Variovorax sp. OV084]